MLPTDEVCHTDQVTEATRTCGHQEPQPCPPAGSTLVESCGARNSPLLEELLRALCGNLLNLLAAGPTAQPGFFHSPSHNTAVWKAGSPQFCFQSSLSTACFSQFHEDFAVWLVRSKRLAGLCPSPPLCFELLIILLILSLVLRCSEHT